MGQYGLRILRLPNFRRDMPSNYDGEWKEMEGVGQDSCSQCVAEDRRPTLNRRKRRIEQGNVLVQRPCWSLSTSSTEDVLQEPQDSETNKPQQVRLQRRCPQSNSVCNSDSHQGGSESEHSIVLCGEPSTILCLDPQICDGTRSKFCYLRRPSI